jgi:glycerophosphoryl diester phosphodiesterase
VRRQPFFDVPRPLVFAHRGGAGLARENTLAAFDRGVACGVDGLELDVRLSRDGVVVVHHDATLERTTSLRGPLAARTAEELEAADVPRLETVLTRYGLMLIIEMKDDTEALAGATVAAIRHAGAVGRVCLGSFGGRVMREARRLEPKVATSAWKREVRWALYRSRLGIPIWGPAYDGFQVPEHFGSTRVVSPRFVAAAHRAGLAVQVWTVDSESDARRLLSWGVDALITDRPDRIVSVARERRS